MTVRRTPIPLLAFGLVVLLAAGIPPAPAAAQRPGFTRDVLPNGLVVLVEERPESGLVAVEVAVLAGARFEYGPTAGAAQFLEQLLQDGTPTRPTRRDVRRAITARGGELDVDVGWERLRLRAEVASEDFALALDVLSDMLLRSKLERERFEAERELILQNLAELEDTPETMLYEVAIPSALGDPTLRHRPSGSPAAVRSLTYESLLAYRAARVVSGNTIVAVVGDVRRAEVLPRVQQAFAALPLGPRQRPTAFPRGPLPPRVERTAGSEQAVVAVAALTPAIAATRDRAALTVLSTYLSGFTGGLMREIRDERGLAYSTGAAVLQMSDIGVFVADAGTAPANAVQVVDLIGAELARVRAAPPSPEDVARAIGEYVDGEIVYLETDSARARDLTWREALYGVAPPREEFLRAVRAVRPADLQAAARRYLAPDHLIQVLLRPSPTPTSER
jgi:predicted Zn-dependent peptidase